MLAGVGGAGGKTRGGDCKGPSCAPPLPFAGAGECSGFWTAPRHWGGSLGRDRLSSRDKDQLLSPERKAGGTTQLYPAQVQEVVGGRGLSLQARQATTASAACSLERRGGLEHREELQTQPSSLALSGGRLCSGACQGLGPDRKWDR